MRNFIKRKVSRLAIGCVRVMMDFAMGMVIRSRPDWNPRNWSNMEIGKLAPLFFGDVINVGAWKDGDKEGGVYRSYFSNAASYTIANYKGEDGGTGLPDEKYIDLSSPNNPSIGTYDLVFCHTVLEHIYPPSLAFDNICKLSTHSVLAVVPFIQGYHGRDGSYGDYTRFSPAYLIEALKERGFKTVYVNWNDDFPVMNVYIVVLATRDPAGLRGDVPPSPKPIVCTCGPGISFSQFLWGYGPRRSCWRRIGECVGAILRVSTESVNRQSGEDER